MMKRRSFIAGLGSAAAWPVVTLGQQASAIPVIGYLFAGLSGPAADGMAANFRRALAESGYIEGQNLIIEYLYADGQYDRLPELAKELVRRRVSLLVATPNYNAALAAKAATSTIPILFISSQDPTKLGLVASISRPEGNVTGVNYLLTEVIPKRLQLLRELIPSAVRIGVLNNPKLATAESNEREVIEAASLMGVKTELVRARDSAEIDAAFATLATKRPDALFVLPDTLFVTRRVQIVTLAARHGIPAIYTVREYVEAGGLISYGPNLTEPFRQLGVYAARILRGAKPADLPVVQTTKIELVINRKAAKALGIDVPAKLLALADEVIE
jgi:putative tryptophan/tyrosine transport system substrate-binding protein